jgi:nitrous oxide reductase accessory protein NosL
MPAPKTGTPLLLTGLTAAALVTAALAGCNNQQVTEPENPVNSSDLAAGAPREMAVGGAAGGTTRGTQEGAGPRELATANTEHAPNQEAESQ